MLPYSACVMRVIFTGSGSTVDCVYTVQSEYEDRRNRQYHFAVAVTVKSSVFPSSPSGTVTFPEELMAIPIPVAVDQ